jgi:hypothetical protein
MRHFQTSSQASISPVHLGNFLRKLATPEPIKDWLMTRLKERLINIGAKIVGHTGYVAFQIAEATIPRSLFADILRMIAERRPPPITPTGQCVWLSSVRSKRRER